MGKMILVIGDPGTGKSTAIEGLDPKSTVIIKPNNKQLPFRGSSKLYNEELGNVVIANEFNALGATLEAINASKSGKVKTIVVEDLTHYFSHRVMKDAKTTGFQKWSDMAVDCFNALIKFEAKLRDDLTVIVVGHTDRMQDAMGNTIITLQTPGKLLENNIKIPSYFTYMLHTDVTEANGVMEYRFLTNFDGTKIAKTPKGCFEKYIPNDYKLVIDTIEKYQKGE